MGVFQNNLLAGASAAASAGGGGFYDYQIENSCRFDYGSYTTFNPPSNGDRKHFTWSVWVKFSRLDLSSSYGYANVVYGTTGGSYNYNMGIVDQTGADAALSYQHKYALNTQKSLSDVGAWYHIVTSYNLDDGTNENRIKIYVNGIEYTGPYATDQRSLMNENSVFNDASYSMKLGRYRASSGYMDGYIAEAIFLDGYVYDSSYFGEFKNGIWIPKDYKTVTGNYGSNGFHLKFENASDLGNDSSGNNNDHSLTLITADHQVPDSPTFGS